MKYLIIVFTGVPLFYSSTRSCFKAWFHNFVLYLGQTTHRSTHNFPASVSIVTAAQKRNKKTKWNANKLLDPVQTQDSLWPTRVPLTSWEAYEAGNDEHRMHCPLHVTVVGAIINSLNIYIAAIKYLLSYIQYSWVLCSPEHNDVTLPPRQSGWFRYLSGICRDSHY